MYEINDLIQYLISPPPPFDQWFLILRNIFIGISLFFFFLIIYFISRTTWLNFRFLESIIEFFTYRPMGAGKIAKQWKKIKHRLETRLESENKLAIIEADSIFNDVLGKMGFGDKSFEGRIERLTSDLLPNIEQVLEAHKIRNNIVYDPDYKLEFNETKSVISIYEKALTDLQAL